MMIPKGATPAARPARSSGVRAVAVAATAGALLAVLTGCGDPDGGGGGGGGGYVVGQARVPSQVVAAYRAT